jgi:RNA polymerase primary sigma factor
VNAQLFDPESKVGPRSPTADRIIEDLQADFDRQSGHLNWDDVHQVVLGRTLSPSDAVEVWQRASDRFPLTAEEPEATISPGGNGLLTSPEERILTRRVAAARLALAADVAGILPAQLKAAICGKGKEAFDQLITSNAGLVGSVAAWFAERTTKLDQDDLFQEGVIGLIRAIEKFDPDRGYKLSTYATCWIRQQLQRALATKARLIRLPSHIEESLRQLRKKRSRLRQSFDRPPTAGELAHELGIEEGDVNLLLQVEEDAALLEDIPREAQEEPGREGRPRRARSGVLDELAKSELAGLIQELLRCLDGRSRFIILQRFGLEGRATHTLQQLGEKFEITRERVRQIEAKSLDRLAEGRQGRALMDFVEE